MKSTFDMRGAAMAHPPLPTARFGRPASASRRMRRGAVAVAAALAITLLVVAILLPRPWGAAHDAKAPAPTTPVIAPDARPQAVIDQRESSLDREGAVLQWSISATTVLALILLAAMALIAQRERRQQRLALELRGKESQRVDAAVQERTASLALANANLTRFSRHSLQTQERERQQLSSELHDQISGQVAAMLMNLHRIGQTIETTANAEAIAALRESVSIARKTFREVCDLAVDLRPTMLDQLGLVATLQWYAREMQQGAECSIDVLAGPVTTEPSASIATAAYRIVQESVSNALRHAQASRIRIEVRQRAQCLELRVRDDGVGFDFDERSADSALTRGFGLLAMRERAIGLGAALTIRSAQGAGTQILLVSPLGAPQDLDRGSAA